MSAESQPSSSQTSQSYQGNLGPRSVMEISTYSHIPGRDVNSGGGGRGGVVGGSPMTSPSSIRRGSATDTVQHVNNVNHALVQDPMVREPRFQQELLKLKHQQELQQQFLLQKFQREQQRLVEQHEQQLQQLQQHMKQYWEQQKLEEEARRNRERQEKEQLDALKSKEKSKQSAVASCEVKKRLMEFVLNKRQREAAANNNSNLSPPNVRNWHHMLRKYDDDFPLRKTASEPNLKVPSRIKQMVIERRSSPLLKRRDKAPVPIKRRPPLTIDTGNSTPDSETSSPPNGTSSLQSCSSSGSTPIQEEQSGTPYGTLSQGNLADLTLYSSPSLPNISLGRPPVPNSPGDNGNKIATMSEEQLRAMAAARLGMPLTGHTLHGMLPFYPSLPVIDGDFTPPTSPAFIQQQMQKLEQNRSNSAAAAAAIIAGLYPGQPITDAQVAQARLHRLVSGRTGHRPLGRTQSAPLPLGHPMLQPQGIILSQERYLQDKQLYEQQQQHNLLKQHIRQTVLTRAGSKNHVENVEEETEAAVMLEMRDQEVIDLTDRSSSSGSGHKSEDSELARQQRERETFLQQQRELMRQTHHTISEESTENDWNDESDTEGSTYGSRHHMGRPLSRALSSPLVTLNCSVIPQDGPSASRHTYTTGLVFDSVMLKHQCVCGDNSVHPEHSGRLQSIWARLQETGLVARCERVRSRKATLEELQSCHSEAYAYLFGTNPLNRQKLDMSKLEDLPIKSFVVLPCGGIGVDSDTTWNDLHTASAAKMAAGCVVELAMKTATGEIKNGFAVVRPPGHHAEHHLAMGFCFFNSVAIAAKQLRQRLRLEKILIVDWDVHHGNGTQQIFYDDPHILYISIHRHDEGNFFPGTGGPKEVGVDDGIGFNVNIAWSGGLSPPMGDAEYMAAFRTIVMPIARNFSPDIILVSAGFDAAVGHPAPLGGYKVSAPCFGHMTRQLLQLANGRVVLALEGGYDLTVICDASQECVRALLSDDIPPMREEEMVRKPCQSAVDTLQRTVAIQAPHWPCIKRWAHTIGYSLVEAQQKEKEEVETVTALASLSMVQAGSVECVFSTSSAAAAVAAASRTSPVGSVSSSGSLHEVDTNQSPEGSPRSSIAEIEEPMEQDTDVK